MDNAIPVLLLVTVVGYMAGAIPNFISLGSLADTSRQIGEFGLIVIGMTVVMLAGGIDLSVGSTFALADFTVLALINVAKWPIELAIVATISVGALVGLINGLLIGYLRLRAFLTTLVMLTLMRAVVEFLLQLYSVQIASSNVEFRFFGFRRDRIGPGRAFQFRGSDRYRDSGSFRIDPPARRLAHHGGRRIAPLGLQRRHPGAAHRVPVLRRLRRAHRPRRRAVRGAAFRRRTRHRHRAGTHGGDGGAARRQQRRRRPRLDRQGADRRGYRLAPDQRARQARTSERRIGDGDRLRAAACDRHRRAVGQMAIQAAIQGLCVPGLSGPAAGPVHRRRVVLALCDERPPERRRDHRSRRCGRSRGRHSRRGRQPLLQCAARRHHPVPRARLHPTRGLRACRRSAARYGIRQGPRPGRVHRRHGPLSRGQPAHHR